MKKTSLLAISIFLSLTLAACGSTTATSSNSSSPSSPSASSQSVQLANPFTDCNTLEDAQKTAGFALTLPETVGDWVTQTDIQAMQDSMIEVVFTGANDQTLRIRKGLGSDDISGIYTQYSNVKDLSVGNNTVTVKGNDNTINLAVWNDGEYAFSLYSSSGLSEEEIVPLISAIQ